MIENQYILMYVYFILNICYKNQIFQFNNVSVLTVQILNLYVTKQSCTVCKKYQYYSGWVSGTTELSEFLVHRLQKLHSIGTVVELCGADGTEADFALSNPLWLVGGDHFSHHVSHPVACTLTSCSDLCHSLGFIMEISNQYKIILIQTNQVSKETVSW